MKAYIDGFGNYLAGRKSDNTIQSYKSDISKYTAYLAQNNMAKTAKILPSETGPMNIPESPKSKIHILMQVQAVCWRFKAWASLFE